jgi:hypothetical protein
MSGHSMQVAIRKPQREAFIESKFASTFIFNIFPLEL